MGIEGQMGGRSQAMHWVRDLGGPGSLSHALDSHGSGAAVLCGSSAVLTPPKILHVNSPRCAANIALGSQVY